MPALVLIIGILLVITAVRDTTGDLATHLDQDLTGATGGVSFWKWVAAIVLIGMVGYIPGLKGVSRAILVLVIVVVLLANGNGLWSKLTTQLTGQVPQEAAGSPTPANLPNPTITVQIAGGSSGGGIGGAISGAAGIVKGIASIAGAFG